MPIVSDTELMKNSVCEQYAPRSCMCMPQWLINSDRKQKVADIMIRDFSTHRFYFCLLPNNCRIPITTSNPPNSEKTIITVLNGLITMIRPDNDEGNPIDDSWPRCDIYILLLMTGAHNFIDAINDQHDADDKRPHAHQWHDNRR